MKKIIISGVVGCVTAVIAGVVFFMFFYVRNKSKEGGQIKKYGN